MISTALLAASCAKTGDGGEQTFIDKPDFKPVDRRYTIEALEALGRVNAPVVSPDTSKILYGVSYESVEQNKSNLDLYVMNTDGTEPKRLTRTAVSENGAVWIDGGRKIAYIAPVDGVALLWGI